MLEFLSTINVYQYNEFRRAVIKKCNISTAAWSYWINGGGVSAKYKQIINETATEMFGRPVFNQEGDKQ